MKRILLILALLSLASACQQQQQQPLPQERCPFGHTTLTRVPILYGLLALDAELQKRIDDLEVWPGGCVVVVGQEKEKLVCKTCRYYFEPHFGYWTKRTDDPKLLQMKADPFIADWPLGPNVRDKGHFYQHVRDKSVCEEEFNGWYNLSEAQTEELVRKHLAQLQHKFEREERDSGDRRSIYYRSFQYPHYFFVEIASRPDWKEIHVRAARSIEKPFNY